MYGLKKLTSWEGEEYWGTGGVFKEIWREGGRM